MKFVFADHDILVNLILLVIVNWLCPKLLRLLDLTFIVQVDLSTARQIKAINMFIELLLLADEL